MSENTTCSGIPGDLGALHDAVGRHVEHVDPPRRRVGHDAEAATGSEAEGPKARLDVQGRADAQLFELDDEDLPRVAATT